MTTVSLATLDVFTDRRFAGNPLGVVCTRAPLDSTTMQRIAAEVNYSETTFVRLADAEAARKAPGTPVPVSIFTPTTELPFAGHPTIGTAAWLREALDLPAPLLLRLGAGDVTVHRVPGPEGSPARYGFVTPEPSVGAALPVPDVALLAGVPEPAIAAQPCSLVRSGPLYLLVPLADRRALDDLAPDLRGLRALGAREGRLPGLYAFTFRVAEDGLEVHARMVFDAGGLREDPGTGSAAAALGGWLRTTSLAPLPATVRIRQGEAMGRPSDLYLHVTERALHLSGSAVPVLRHGRLEID